MLLKRCEERKQSNVIQEEDLVFTRHTSLPLVSVVAHAFLHQKKLTDRDALLHLLKKAILVTNHFGAHLIVLRERDFRLILDEKNGGRGAVHNNGQRLVQFLKGLFMELVQNG